MTSWEMRGDYTATMKWFFWFVCLLLCATLLVPVRMRCCSMSEWILKCLRRCVDLISCCLFELVVIVLLFACANRVVQIRRLLRWQKETAF